MKNTREIANEYRMTHWAEIMRRRTESGMSIRKFCEIEGMHPNRYHYWQRRLRNAVAELKEAKPEVAQLPPSGWTQISADKEVEKCENAGVTIEIGKSRISVNSATDTELLRKVCAVLVDLC